MEKANRYHEFVENVLFVVVYSNKSTGLPDSIYEPFK